VTQGPQVLVIDDEPQILRALRTILQEKHFRVTVASRGEEGLALAAANPPDVVILDLGLPDLSGIEVCARLRAWTQVPIIVLSVRDSEVDKVQALDRGADDYLTKPFGIRELIARVRALLRRPRRSQMATPGVNHGEPVSAGGLVVDPARRHARVDSREIELTAHEFELLHLLAANPGIVFSREALMQRVWGEETFVTTRSVDTLVKRLRRKIEPNPEEPRFILTVWGTGYKFADV
jgi:two-component system, OmpR family, KDP operon response regulator KdpE